MYILPSNWNIIFITLLAKMILNIKKEDFFIIMILLPFSFLLHFVSYLMLIFPVVLCSIIYLFSRLSQVMKLKKVNILITFLSMIFLIISLIFLSKNEFVNQFVLDISDFYLNFPIRSQTLDLFTIELLTTGIFIK